MNWKKLLPWRRKRIGKFEKFIFPIIKNMPSSLLISDLMSVQPMINPDPSLIFKFEILDENNPQLGQRFRVRPKYPLTHPEWYDWNCCCRGDYWERMWTRNGWVHEQNLTTEEWQELIEVYDYLKTA